MTRSRNLVTCEISPPNTRDAPVDAGAIEMFVMCARQATDSPGTQRDGSLHLYDWFTNTIEQAQACATRTRNLRALRAELRASGGGWRRERIRTYGSHLDSRVCGNSLPWLPAMPW